MVEIIPGSSFEKGIKRIKDKKIKERVKKQILKLIENPESGKFLIGERKGERKIYIGPFRLLYAYKDDKIYLIDFDKRDRIYKKK
ncbi:MAG: type II toxin-antitoxin system RelE/ParE family toxin [Nanoarchaeota archaeon]|nr:type II toxin-antitoxin system RelE/ParE family toxin [Nanoarchaeota archaeon]MBU1444896.1 type II toxin-antitoxin system RelE/ParE family toxin [Nanoarchaeota archaeon]MBU2420227.1 type II toxin-antitoxin system RelE/ParE family toxin [Nanoarchaeota archaeon]MBU2475231.1 type II toxin-antitoxin system RelE/ParE family toxin [Nanoarchaeota archaeon]MBU3941143.1 type II toxin-antitoxin system RelE/ParE family toxin [Nanoarchaeota archaeon]